MDKKEIKVKVEGRWIILCYVSQYNFDATKAYDDETGMFIKEYRSKCPSSFVEGCESGALMAVLEKDVKAFVASVL